jgi:hypothetical protein
VLLDLLQQHYDLRIQHFVITCDPCNSMRPRALPCNQDPQKKKGAITLSCSVANYLRGDTLRGNSCNAVQSCAIPCNLMRPRAIPCNQNPQRTFFPFSKCAFSPLGLGITQPSSASSQHNNMKNTLLLLLRSSSPHCKKDPL